MIGKLDDLTDGRKLSDLRQISESISEKYKNQNGGQRLITKADEALVYALTRMPSTYEAIKFSLREALKCFNGEINTCVDMGAGTGAGALAVKDCLENVSTTCVEREDEMIKIGKKLVNDDILWTKSDLDSVEETNADLVIASYVLNEISQENRLNTAKKLFDMTGKLLLIVDSGTPKIFNQMKALREYFIGLGGKILSPCPHQGKCQAEWCNFGCRVQRSKIHKYLKSAESGYEDEKFTFLAISKSQTDGQNFANRILRHPYIEKGKISLEVCTAEGIKKVIVKKDDTNYKEIKKVDWGEGY